LQERPPYLAASRSNCPHDRGTRQTERRIRRQLRPAMRGIVGGEPLFSSAASRRPAGRRVADEPPAEAGRHRQVSLLQINCPAAQAPHPAERQASARRRERMRLSSAVRRLPAVGTSDGMPKFAPVGFSNSAQSSCNRQSDDGCRVHASRRHGDPGICSVRLTFARARPQIPSAPGLNAPRFSARPFWAPAERPPPWSPRRQAPS